MTNKELAALFIEMRNTEGSLQHLRDTYTMDVLTAMSDEEFEEWKSKAWGLWTTALKAQRAYHRAKKESAGI